MRLSAHVITWQKRDLAEWNTEKIAAVSKEEGSKLFYSANSSFVPVLVGAAFRLAIRTSSHEQPYFNSIPPSLSRKRLVME